MAKAFAKLPAKADYQFMLPGFRFLFIAVVLSLSIMIFGLGAASLLRSAHQEFANLPIRRAPPENIFSQMPEAPPRLAMLTVEPRASESVETIAPATVSIPGDTSEPAAWSLLDNTTGPQTPAAETAGMETVAPAQTVAPAETLAPATPVTEPPPVSAGSAAPIETTASIASPTMPDTAATPPEPAIDVTSGRLATLGGPAADMLPVPRPVAKPAATPTRTVRKRIVKRRRVVARAAPVAQRPADPFAAQPLR